MGIGPDEYRETLKNYASGVTIVTVEANGQIHGMTASSFASVSLQPPLVLVCLANTAKTHQMVMEKRSFAVNVLRSGQAELAAAFAKPGQKDFGPEWDRKANDGSPMTSTALALMECGVVSVYEGGDHDIVLADVRWSQWSEGQPLIYFNRHYRSVLDLDK
jgi:flavin reductase (DIM6/NTAB) family NADH-FMN oxidoreductase RutF